jgi:hypothetical protein
VAEEAGISKSTVARYFTLFGLQPHRSKSFKVSTDPFFVGKIRDVVGLYLNPPDKALVCAWTRKAKSRRWSGPQPVLPKGLGNLEGVTHDYYRHCTTTLFAALNVLNGSVVPQCKPRHRHQEFPAFPIQREVARLTPLIRLFVVSRAALRPNNASIAQPGRVAIPPPKTNPTAEAIAKACKGLSRMLFSSCRKSSLSPVPSRYFCAVSLTASSAFFAPSTAEFMVSSTLCSFVS